MLLTSGIISGMEAVTYLLWKSISDNFKEEYLKIFSGQLSPLPGVISFTLYLISSLVICYFCQTSALAILGTEFTLSLVIFMYSMHVYMSDYICVKYICSSISICMHVYVCVCVYRHEMTSRVILDNSSLCWLRSPPQLNSELINLASLACQLALEVLSPPLTVWNYRWVRMPAWLLCKIWGFDLRCSHLCKEFVNHPAISAALKCSSVVAGDIGFLPFTVLW